MVKNNNISADNKLTPLQINAHAKSRANLTKYHLNSAIQFSQKAFKIEQTYRTQEIIPENIHTSHMSYVSTSIISSVTALESSINEFLVDLKERYGNKAFEKNSHVETIMDTFEIFNHENMFESLFSKQIPVISKYKILSLFIQKKDLLTQLQVEDINYLVKLRNALIHFTPEWDNALNRHRNIEKSLKNRFSLNPLRSNASTFFPYKCLSSSCSLWSYRVSKKSIKHYFQTL